MFGANRLELGVGALRMVGGLCVMMKMVRGGGGVVGDVLVISSCVLLELVDV